MDENFETVLLDVLPTVKVETIDNDDTYQPTAADAAETETKIEFSLFVQFTFHIEKHLQEIGANVISIKSDCDFDVIDVKPPIFDANDNFSDETTTSSINDNALPSDEVAYRPSIKQNPRPKGSKKAKANKYSCTVCNFRALRKGTFLQHMENQHPNVPKTKISEKGRTYVCGICNTTVAYRKSMLRHIKNVHPTDDVYSFDIINVENEVESVTRQSPKIRDLNDEPNCAPELDEVTADQTEHQTPKTKIAEKGQTYVCKICNTTVSYRKSIIRHIKNAHPIDDVYSFDIIKDDGNLQTKHSFTRNTEKMIKPDESNHENLLVETAVIDTDPPSKAKIPNERKLYVCKLCKSTTIYRKSIIRHVKNVHPTADVYSFDIIKDDGTTKIGSQKMKIPAESNQGECIAEVGSINIDPPPKAKIPDKRKMYACKICKTTTSLRKSIIRHIKNTHPVEDSYSFDIIDPECPVNMKKSQTANEANESNREAELNEEAAGATAADQQIPKTKIAEKGRMYACKICNAIVSYRKSMVRHIKATHPNESMLEFDVINRDDGISSISKEIRCFYPRKDYTYECYLCHSPFSEWLDVRNHFRKIHYNFSEYREKFFNVRTCKLCNEEFRDTCSFDKHKRWHRKQNDSRPHQCHLCEKAYRARHELKRHLAKHVRDFTCEICHKSYSQLNKVSHMRRHSGEMKVQCDECGRFFSASDKLKRHMRTHTGETPYECQFCHKRFRQSYNLAVHRRMHTGEYIHYCKPCEKGFGGRRELKKHNLRFHGVDEMDGDKRVTTNNEAAEHPTKSI